MVAYCCVKGCNNNSSNKKKDPSKMTSFHAFPCNLEMKQKWLKAIGRPDWIPPSYARICSVHFSYEQINHDGRRIRIKDDAVPTKDLPANSNFEASDVEVCRFCLAAEARLHSLQDGVHKVYMESLVGYNENYHIEGLPQFVCYECAAYLKKCYKLLEKSLTVQATLLDIFAQYGKITIDLINAKNRKELHLTSSLTVHDIKAIHEFKYSKNLKDYYVEEAEDEYIGIPKLGLANMMTPETIKGTEVYLAMDLHSDKDTDLKDDDISDMFVDRLSTSADMSSEDEVKPEIENTVYNQESKPKQVKKSVKSIEQKGLTPDEVSMQEYFDVVRLNLTQQIEEWNKEKEELSGASFKCQICSKMFVNQNTYKLHTQSHDPSRGSAECPVCKLRFKNEVLANSHANRAHAKKFFCKLCPKAFNNVSVAKKHHKRHTGYVYKCSYCAFKSLHASALGTHTRARHGGAHGHACARCGRAFVSARGLRLHAATAHGEPAEPEENPKYRCQQCNLNFKSEGARRVHVLTSGQHRIEPNLCDATPQDQSLKTTCKKCGVEFPTLKALIEHGRAEHRRIKKKTSWRLPDDSYPTQCDYCDTTVANRAEHWRHVRQQHPAHRAAYRAVITAVCDTCGKGFQNSTKLQLHVLRHGPPTVPCGACTRVFHDKYALARHAAAHAHARPHRCARCPRAFKQKANLDRHERVHTGVTPYECSMCGKRFKYSTSMNLHVRTVHYKLPHPPRKRKNKKLHESDVNYGK